MNMKGSLDKVVKKISENKAKTIIIGVVALVIIAFVVIASATPLIFPAKISFETGEGSEIDSFAVRKGTTLPSDIDVPNREYYTFEGWYYDSNFTKPYNNEKINKQLTLYAKWQTIFTREFFTKKVQVINEIYGINAVAEDVIYTDKSTLVLNEDDDELTKALLKEDIDLIFSLEVGEVMILSAVMHKAEDASRVVALFEEYMPEDVLDMLNFLIKDRAVFIFFGDMYKVIFDEIVYSDDYIYSTKENEEYNIMRYLGQQKHLVLPTSFNGKPVTSIGSLAFHNSAIEQVNIPESVTKISFGAFFEADQLKEFVFPSSIKTINTAVLISCDKLEKIVLPPNLQNIDSGAFVDMNGLKEIIIDEANSYYKTVDGVLYNDEMTSLFLYPAKKRESFYVIPEGVTEIGISAFHNATELKSVTFPETLQYINASAFSNTGLENAHIPKNVLFIGGSAFCDDIRKSSQLKTLTFAEGSKLHTIGENAFVSSYIQEVTLPASLKSIGIGAFRDCQQLRQVQFQQGIDIDILAPDLFNNCQALQTIVIPDTVTKISKSVFENCTNLKTITLPANIKIINEKAFSSCQSLSTIEIPSTLEKIGDNAFIDCKGLTEFSLPIELNNIGMNILLGCDAIVEVILPYINWQDEGKGYLEYYFGVGNMGLPQSIKKVTLLNEFSYLPDKIFENCQNIEEVVFPQTVSMIGNLAFKNCISLSSVSLYDNITQIGRDAFYDCVSLGQITLPAALESVYDSAFCIDNNSQENTTVINISVTNKIKEIGYRAFSHSKVNGTVVFNDDLYMIGEQAFFECFDIENVVFNTDNVVIDKGIFQACNNIKSMTIPLNENYQQDTNSYLSYYFGGSNFHANNIFIPQSLETVNVLNGSRKIAENAFSRCENLKYVNLPQSVTELSNNAFSECTNLLSIDSFSQNLVAVGNHAFFNCASLTDISFSHQLESIGEYAFENCSSLLDIDLSSVTQIGKGALRYCENLVEMTIPIVEPYNQNTNSYLYYYFNGDGTSANNVMYYSDKLKVINVVDNGIESVPERAFSNFLHIEYINLPQGIITVQSYAFNNCQALKEINLPSSLKEIGDYAFAWCKSLVAINLPQQTEQIGRYAFADCDNIVSVNIPEGSQISDIRENAFSQCLSLENIKLPDYSVYQIEDRVFYKCVSLKQFVFPKGLQYIRVASFEESGLISLSFPRTLLEIGLFAFRNCKSITDVVFENLYENFLHTIERESFLGCELITEIVFPTSLLAIVGDTFKGCANLKKVVVLREFNYLRFWKQAATALNSEGVFDDCHEDLAIYVPKNNAGITEDNPETEAKNGVTMYKSWFSWVDYADIIYPIPEDWSFE